MSERIALAITLRTAENPAMTEEQFWQIIQRSFDACGGDTDEQTDALAEQLEPLSPDEIRAFEKIFYQKHHLAYSWDLWGAAYILNGGCSDDGFHYFKTWLISRGKKCFEAAIENADSLADYSEQLGDDTEFEEFAYVARRVYEQKTGNEMPDDDDVAWISGPTGDEWDEDDDEGYKRRWPKLYAKYLAE